MDRLPSAGVPNLETSRTILRAHRMDDFDAYVAMWADPDVTRFIGGRPRTREESWQRFLRHAGCWSLIGYGFWAIEDKKSGAFLGEAGFHDAKRDMTPSIEGIPEAGWGLAPQAHGRGLATEIVGAVLAWGDENLDEPKSVCIIDPGNTASIRVAEKCGYREVLRTSYHGEPTVLFERQFRG